MMQAVRSDTVVTMDRKKGKVLRTLVDLRKLVLDSKDMLIEYTALLRLANPFLLAIVGAATVVGGVVVFAAVIALFVVLF